MIGDLEKDIDGAQERLALLFLDVIENYFPDYKGEGNILEFIEKPLYDAIMRYHRGNQSKAAIHLKIARGTLRKNLDKYFKNVKNGNELNEVINGL